MRHASVKLSLSTQGTHHVVLLHEVPPESDRVRLQSCLNHFRREMDNAAEEDVDDPCGRSVIGIRMNSRRDIIVRESFICIGAERPAVPLHE